MVVVLLQHLLCRQVKAQSTQPWNFLYKDLLGSCNIMHAWFEFRTNGEVVCREQKGVKVRIELGPRDAHKSQACLAICTTPGQVAKKVTYQVGCMAAYLAFNYSIRPVWVWFHWFVDVPSLSFRH